MGIFNLFKHKSEAAPELPQTRPELAPEMENGGSSQPMTSLNAFVEEACPSASGLYPQEILMLFYAPEFHPAGNTFQKFWADQYGVCFPQAILDRLLEGGYIEAAGIRETVSHLTTAKLKKLLTQFGLSTAGKKADMVRRLTEMEDLSGLEMACPERYFIYTEKGTRELEENRYISYFHSHRNSISLSIWEASRRVHREEPPRALREVLLEYLQTEADRHYQACDFRQYRNTCLAAHTALLDAELPQEAFHCLCETACYDLSGLGDGETLLLDESTEGRKAFLTAKLQALDKHLLDVVPAVKQWFRKKKEEMGGTDESFREMLIQEFSEIQIPFRIFTGEECADILLAVIRGDAETPERLLRMAGARLEEELKGL